MMRAQWLTAGSWLLLFWLLAGMMWAPAVERRLARAAAEVLAEVETGHGPVEVRFEGQRSVLSGRVRHEAVRLELLRRVADDLRLPGAGEGLNPVDSVRDEMQVAPYPPGWLLLAVSGRRAALAGRASSEEEARDMTRLLQERWMAAGGRMEPALAADPARFDEAPDVRPTLTHFPAPPEADGPDSARLYLARLGGGWQRLPPDATEAALRAQAERHGLSEQDWHSVQDALLHIRRYQDQERARLAELERQSRLPPPHVLLAARGGRLLVRGELARMAQKRALLNLLIASFPDWRVLDDLRVSPARRAVAEFGPVTTALLPRDQEAGGKSLVLGLSGKAWEFIPWKEGQGEMAQKWREQLPPDLPAALLEADLRMVTEWLEGGVEGIPALPVPPQPSFLTLTLLPGKAVLAGQLAEEPMRMRIVQAARRAYGGQVVLLADGLLARGTCEPTEDIEQTVRSLPPLPKAGGPPILAFARPGQVWRTLPADEAALRPGSLAGSPLLPEGFPAAMAEDTFADGFDHLRHYWRPAGNHATKDTDR